MRLGGPTNLGDERGTGSLLLIVAGAVFGLAAAAAALVAVVATHTRVTAAADLTALATGSQLLVQSDPCLAAEQVAAANQVQLDSCGVEGARVIVAVSARWPPLLRAVLPTPGLTARACAEVVIDDSR